MKVKVVITVDTEEDCWADYKREDCPLDNIRRIPHIQKLFDKYGAVPTYLVNYAVAQNEIARRVLLQILERQRCEIGTHCHPWNTPPFEEELGGRNTMMCNLPQGLILRKMETLHTVITDGFSVSPAGFRAGRWGFGAGVAHVIHSLGYRIDTSVTPYVDWGQYDGPDFRKAQHGLYRFDPDDILVGKSGGAILELPPTIGYLQMDQEYCHTVRTWIAESLPSGFPALGILDRLGINNFRWLSPELSNGKEMIHLAKTMIRLGHRYLNIPFHSTTLLPGKTPFVRSAEQLERFLENLETFFKFAAENDFMFVPLSEATAEEKG